MSLLIKSDENQKAFIILKEHDYYTPAVHCCYYSCIQLVIAFLQEFYPNEHEKEVNLNEKNSHKRQIDLFIGYYYDLNSKQATLMKRHLFALKDLRRRSDYTAEQITLEQIDTSEKHLKDFHRILKKDVPNLFE